MEVETFFCDPHSLPGYLPPFVVSSAASALRAVLAPTSGQALKDDEVQPLIPVPGRTLPVVPPAEGKADGSRHRAVSRGDRSVRGELRASFRKAVASKRSNSPTSVGRSLRCVASQKGGKKAECIVSQKGVKKEGPAPVPALQP